MDKEEIYCFWSYDDQRTPPTPVFPPSYVGEVPLFATREINREEI